MPEIDLATYHPPETYLYTKEHEWTTFPDPNGIVMIGITDYATGELGDVVYLDPPSVRSKLIQFEKCAEVKSVKAVSDIYSPVSGEVVGINDRLVEQPELVNKSPFEQGWIAQSTPFRS